MRNPVSAFRSRSVYQASLIILIAGMSASCSNSLRLGEEPAFTGSTENQREILGQNDAGSNGGGAYQPMLPRGRQQRRDQLGPAASAGDELCLRRPGAGLFVLLAVSDTTPAGGNFTWTAVGGRVITVAPARRSTC
ncbi:MAG: hypothetical protein WDM84_09490 [Bauldia sp.]